METSILEVSSDGLEIQLMDCSTWTIVNNEDVKKTILWHTTQRIRIKVDSKGNYTLINLDTTGPDQVKVNRIQ